MKNQKKGGKKKEGNLPKPLPSFSFKRERKKEKEERGFGILPFFLSSFFVGFS